MTRPTLTTELDAVNQMLDVIGEAPVTSIDDTGLVDAALARDLLRRVSREVQAKRWYWNTDYDIELVPLSPLPNDILVPSNAIHCDPVDAGIDAVVREGKLWDRRARTFAWTTSVKCQVTWLLPLESLPEVARQYIAIRACRKFQDRRIGSETRNGFSERDELDAKVDLDGAEADAADLSMANSFSVARALNPRAPQGIGWR